MCGLREAIIKGHGRILQQRVDAGGADQPCASFAGGDGGRVGISDA